MALEHYIENDNFNLIVDEEQTLDLFENISPQSDTFYDLGEHWLQNFFPVNYIKTNIMHILQLI